MNSQKSLIHILYKWTGGQTNKTKLKGSYPFCYGEKGHSLLRVHNPQKGTNAELIFNNLSPVDSHGSNRFTYNLKIIVDYELFCMLCVKETTKGT